MSDAPIHSISGSLTDIFFISKTIKVAKNERVSILSALFFYGGIT